MHDYVLHLLSAWPWPWLCAVVALFACMNSVPFIGFIVPGETVVVIGGAVAARSGGPVLFLVGAAALASVAGDLSGYVVGTAAGPRMQRSRLGRKIGASRWERSHHFLRRRGGQAVFLARFLPVAQVIMPMLAGAASMRVRRFITWTLPSALLWAVVFVGAGYVAGESFARASDEVTMWLAGLLAVAAVGVAVVRWQRRRWQRRRPSGFPVAA